MDLSRRTNGLLKMKERIRRTKRMHELLQKGKLPYTPTIMSWVSAALDKPTRQITQADIDQLLKEAK
jgi:hypothetical protein